MARGLNKVMLIGNLGQDPEVRETQSGQTVTNVSLATSEQWTDKNTGEKKEQTEWHRLVFWGKVAEIAGEYLSKGSKIFVEGQLQTRQWEDKAGATRYTTEVRVRDMQMLSYSDQGEGGGGGGHRRGGGSSRPRQAPPREGVDYPPPDEGDDLPF